MLSIDLQIIPVVVLVAEKNGGSLLAAEKSWRIVATRTAVVYLKDNSVICDTSLLENGTLQTTKNEFCQMKNAHRAKCAGGNLAKCEGGNLANLYGNHANCMEDALPNGLGEAMPNRKELLHVEKKRKP